MRLTRAIAVLACFLSGPVFAADIDVGEVSGQVWYAKGGGNPPTLLTAHSRVNEGTFVTNINGEVYAVPFPGSRFRLASLTAVEVKHNQLKTSESGGQEVEAALALSRGKLTGFISPSVEGLCCYDIQLAGGRLSVKRGMFVICVHGDGAHIYIAQGGATLYPLRGPYKDKGIRIEAQTNIALLSDDGELQIRPMTRVAPGMSNCLLSGATPEIVEHIEEGSPRAANLIGATEVSASH